MTDRIKDFVDRARDVKLDEAAVRLGLKVKNPTGENPQPCPVTGGRDRFSFNPQKKAWHCRQCDAGGHDAIGMAAHNLELDVRRRDGLLAACSAVLGEDVPEEGERESDEDRAAREKRLADRRAAAEAAAARHEADRADFRAKERRKAKGIFDAAMPMSSVRGDHVRDYLRRRGCGVPDDRWLRISAEQTYWHGKDERGFGRAIHAGPAMIAPFIAIAPDLSFEIVGCHITWIDPAAAPKYRPVLVDPDTGELLPTKKMRGTKKGGVIPLAGRLSAARWLGAEGIENALAFARYEGFRDDTFYFAAGDLGNMAGPADPKSRRGHPALKKPDKAGRLRPVMVPGPVPRAAKPDGEPEAMVIPDHVTELVLLGDGDSEPVMTAAAMVRAKARHARPGRLIPIIMPRGGTDFAAMLAGCDEAYA